MTVSEELIMPDAPPELIVPFVAALVALAAFIFTMWFFRAERSSVAKEAAEKAGGTVLVEEDGHTVRRSTRYALSALGVSCTGQTHEVLTQQYITTQGAQACGLCARAQGAQDPSQDRAGAVRSTKQQIGSADAQGAMQLQQQCGPREKAGLCTLFGCMHGTGC